MGRMRLTLEKQDNFFFATGENNRFHMLEGKAQGSSINSSSFVVSIVGSVQDDSSGLLLGREITISRSVAQLLWLAAWSEEESE
jgi:hypothetical protein